MIKIPASTPFSTLPARSGFFLFVLLITAANLRAPLTATGPILEDIRLTFSLSATEAGLLNFIPLMMFALFAPLSAWLSNRFGLERTLWAAVWSIGLGSLLRITGSPEDLWLGTTILSAGIATANVLLPPLIKRDAREHTAKYIGLYASTMAITASLASGISAELAQATSKGWFLSTAVWLLPVGIALIAWLPLLKKSGLTLSSTATPSTRLKSPWRSALGWQVSLFMAFQSMVFYTLIAWFTPFAESNGFSQVSAGWLLFIYQIVAVLANLACTVALKKLHDQRLTGFLASLATFSGLTGLLLLPHLAVLWLIVAGLGAGASMVTCLSLFNLRAADHRQASHLSGMAQCVGYGLAALGPLTFGFVHEQSAGWALPLQMLIVVSLLQLTIAPLAGRKKVIG